MAIRTGIGVGGAQIFDTSGVIDTYGRQIAQQQKAQVLQAEKQAKEQAKFDEELATAMAGIKTDGVDPKTAEYIQNEYLKVKNLRAEAEKLNPSQRPLFLQGVKDKMNSLKEFSANAKDFNSKLFSMGGKLNDWDYDKTTLGRYKKLSETPYYQLTPEEKALNPTMFQKRPNFGLIDKIIDETYKNAEEKADFKGEIKNKGKRANVKEVKPEVVSEMLDQQFNYNPQAQYALEKLYTQTTGDTQPTPEKISKFKKDLYVKKHGYTYTGEYKDLKEPKGSGDGKKATDDELFSTWINGAFTGDYKNSIENLNTISGNNAKITYTPQGIKVTYKPIINVGGGGVPLLIENPKEETKIVKTPRELAQFLRIANVTGSGSKTVSKLNRNVGVAPTKPQTKPVKELTWAEKQAAKKPK